MEIIVPDTVMLFIAGLAGWALFSKFNLPVAPFLGSLFLVSLLRFLGLELAETPAFLFPLLQVGLGIFVGTKVNRQVLRELRPIFTSALTIVAWALAIVFLLGPLLARLTALQQHTTILASSMGGLPEITMIALAIDADLGFIILMQAFRMMGTVFLFPFILKKWVDNKSSTTTDFPGINHTSGTSGNTGASSIKEAVFNLYSGLFLTGKKPLQKRLIKYFRPAGKGILVSAAALSGGFLFHYAGIPAGAMVGATIFVSGISLAGINPGTFPPTLFNLMLAALGLTVADNIMPESVAELADPLLLGPALFATALIFITSFLVTLLIKRVSGWDLATCFLAAAPGGFSIMVALAGKYNLDPMRVSILHLCRLLSLKTVIPLVFAYLV